MPNKKYINSLKKLRKLKKNKHKYSVEEYVSRLEKLKEEVIEIFSDPEISKKEEMMYQNLVSTIIYSG